MKRYNQDDQRILGAWAADCAERVLPVFEKLRPADTRPRQAIYACREWVRTGEFRMADIRKASLDAHAAAREVTESAAARFAARAAGQAVATAHVPQHAFGAAWYALKSLAGAEENNVDRERGWQALHLAGHLRAELERLTVCRSGRRVIIRFAKDGDF